MTLSIVRTTTALALAGATALGLGGWQASTATAAHLPATPVTVRNLPSLAEMHSTQGLEHAKVSYTVAGGMEGSTSMCVEPSWISLGGRHQYTRFYEDTTSIPVHAAVSIASFPTHARAVTAARRMGASFAGCRARLVQRDESRGGQQFSAVVTLPTGQPAWLSTQNMMAAPHEQDNFIIENGVTVTGTHVEFITINADDTNGSLGTEDMHALLTRTVKNLV